MPRDRDYFAIAPLTGSAPLMISATDSAPALKAPVASGLGLLPRGPQPGRPRDVRACARSRRTTRPCWGPRPLTDRDRTITAVRDLYADRMAGASGRAGAALAQVGPDHRASLGRGAHGSGPRARPSGPVALEAPRHAPRGPPGRRRATPIPDHDHDDRRVGPGRVPRPAGRPGQLPGLAEQAGAGRRTRWVPPRTWSSASDATGRRPLEWPNGPHKRREVLYSASENGGLMHVNMADSLLPVPRLSLPPTARSSCTTAGTPSPKRASTPS